MKNNAFFERFDFRLVQNETIGRIIRGIIPVNTIFTEKKQGFFFQKSPLK